MDRALELRVAGLLVECSRLLMACHDRRGKRYWVVPGGHVEPGEGLAAALVREFREETGLEVEVADLVMANDVLLPDRHVVNLYFALRCPDAARLDDGKPMDPGVSELAFFEAAALAALDLRPGIAEELSRFAAGHRPPHVYLGIR